MLNAREIVSKMMEKDAFSQWMGIEIKEIKPGYCLLISDLKDDMLNGFQILHGGICYSLADSALAFASNTYGKKCVSIETSISHTRPVQINDQLTTECIELNRGKSYGIYQVTIKNQEDKTVALFKGTVHISEDLW
jgi:acyl-CoA thioesterase